MENNIKTIDILKRNGKDNSVESIYYKLQSDKKRTSNITINQSKKQ